MPINATLPIPGSEAITCRALLIAALSEGVSEISGIRINKNTKALINALHQLGIVTQLDEKTRSCIIAGCNGKFPKKQANIWTDDAAIVARFLLTACSATSGVYYFDGSTKLRERKLIQLLHILQRQGVQVIPSDSNKMPFTLVGTDNLEGGTIILDVDSHSQILSALLMISPYARSPFVFTATNALNHPNIEITCALMSEFGVLVHRVHQNQFMVPVPQRYQAKDYNVEPDFSLASYFFAAVAVTDGEITIPQTKRSQSKQPSIKFLSALEKMGCTVSETHAGLKVKGSNELQGIEISMRDFSDTFLSLTAIAPFTKSPTRISHIGQMQEKELFRMNVIKTELINLGIKIETGEDWIKIFPGRINPAKVSSHNDYHLALALSIIALKIPGLIIEDLNTVIEHHRELFKLWNTLKESININA